MAQLVIRTKGLPAETLELKKGMNRLGRSGDNDFRIVHDTISRFHCEVEVKEDSIWVHDLDSSNGTFVNDVPVEGRVKVTEADTLRLGDVSLEIKDAPAPIDETKQPPCTNHPEIAATMVCVNCKLRFCGSCVHVLQRSGGKVVRLCPACSGYCESIKGMNQGQGGLLDKMKNMFKQ